jgi:hypothetical protein
MHYEMHFLKSWQLIGDLPAYGTPNLVEHVSSIEIGRRENHQRSLSSAAPYYVDLDRFHHR